MDKGDGGLDGHGLPPDCKDIAVDEMRLHPYSVVFRGAAKKVSPMSLPALVI